MTLCESYSQYVQNVCDEFNCRQAVPALLEGFAQYCASNPQLEGASDWMKKFGKYAAIGALALNAANAHAAPNKTYHQSPRSNTKASVLASKTHHNLWHNKNYDDRVMEIFNFLKQQKIKSGKQINDQILYDKAQALAQSELTTGQKWKSK